MTEPSAILRAIEKGVAFLESAQLPGGEIPIETAPTREMTSDCVRTPVVFPAAVAARTLSLTPSAERVRSRALDFLQREMEPGGLWRHPSSDQFEHHYTPLDVDDTSLASSALRAAGRPVPDNRALLLANRERSGLFRTWIVRWWPHPRMTYRFFRTYGRVRDVDSVVNANVVSYLGLCKETRAAVQHILEVLRSNREMASTIWYESRFTVWYFFSHALLEIAPEAGEIITARIAETAPVNTLQLALATSTLLLWNRIPDVEPLIEAQLPSGAWPRAGFYHMGKREMDIEPKTPWWGSEALTTVFAIEALTRSLSAITARERHREPSLQTPPQPV